MEATIKIPPGVVRGASPADTPGTWYETNLVRWVNGVLQPVPGWEKLVATVPASKVRAVHQWVDNDNIEYIGVLCEEHIYVYRDGALQDITPAGGMDGPGENVLAGGYGNDNYNYGDYGTPRPDVPATSMIGPAYSIDNWGEDLIVMSNYDGRLLRWKPSDPLVACTAVPGAPVNNRCFVITPQRHVIIFGMGGDFRRFGWCSQEDIEDWDFADPLNTAGEFFIEPASPILCAKALKSGVIFFSAIKAYFIEYLGVPYVYGYNEIGDRIAPISAASLVSSGDKASWWAENGVWSFDSGSLQAVPCTLLDWAKKEADPDFKRFRTFGQAIGEVTEVWWFFPTVGQQENDRYMAWNYSTGEWSMGWLNRTAGTPGSYLTYPIMSDGASLFYHEKGDRYGDNMLPFAETAAINMKSGGRLMTIKQMVPDHVYPNDVVKYIFYGRDVRVPPGSDQEEVMELETREDGYLDVRMTARDFRMRIASAQDGVPKWSFGEMLIDVAQRGKR
jgi:hypothetical protein